MDGISFESRTDWIVGENSSNNENWLTFGNAGKVRALDAAVFIGANAGANNNCLRISGELSAIENLIGAFGNHGNKLILDSMAINDIDLITLHENNVLVLEGNLTTFSLLDNELETTMLFSVCGSSESLITSNNFDDLLLAEYDDSTGYTSFTAICAIPEPSMASFVLLALAGFSAQRKRRITATAYAN